MRFSHKILGLAAAMAVGASASVAFAQTTITGAGATFPFPIYAKWADEYKKSTGTAVNYQSIGSGGGIKQIQPQPVACRTRRNPPFSIESA